MNVFLGYPPENIKQWIKDHYNTGPDLSIPLCFTAVDAGATIALKCNGNNLKTATFQTSTDGNTWTDYTYTTAITLANAGDKVYFKATADNTSIARTSSNYLRFTTTQTAKKVNVSGNVMSLLSPEFKDLKDLSTIKDGKPGTYEFYTLFSSCNNIYDASELMLPATTLAGSCYRDMFMSCTSLTKAPELPATTLSSDCYTAMFQYCTSLVELPAIKTYESGTQVFYSMLDEFDWNTGAWGQQTTCNWPDLTLSDVGNMVVMETIFGDSIFGSEDPGEDTRINITCKDGSGVAYFVPGHYTWVFEY